MDVVELGRLYRAQTRLVTAVHDLSLARTVAGIQEIVRLAARQIAAADGATFVLRDRDQCFYADEDAISPLWKGKRFPMSACISGWAMLHRDHAVIPDIYADPRIPADAYRPTFVKSLVMVPIRRTDPIGAIGVYWANRRQATPEEVGLLQALANTTAVAMENVQVYAELEQRVATRTAELENVNRELEAFSSSVSHDLRAPLRAIDGFSQMLARRPSVAADPEAQRCVEVVCDSVRKMRGLIDDLLRLARFSGIHLRRQDADLAEIAREIVGRLRRDHPQRNVEVLIPDRLPACCDPDLFGVVMENLLSNAWKYSSKTPAARIELGLARQDDGEDAIYVRDNGAGFDPHYASKLFAPFQRLHTEAQFPGTGIGLATVQRIVHRHGGRVWAEAEVDRGATFYFTCGDGTPRPHG